jgi:hypothetical protein
MPVAQVKVRSLLRGIARFDPSLKTRLYLEVPRPTRGPVAQLGARMNGIHEVTGSIPVWSTNLRSRLPNQRELRLASSHAKVAHRSLDPSTRIHLGPMLR